MQQFKMVVLAKQVPDTRNVGKDAMTAEGTVNRAALPAIFNPDDLNALEQALRIKDQYPQSTLTVLTMGPARAAEIVREGLFRGADNGYLLSDRAFAGADTLATSYALATAIRKIGDFDLILCGRQAIDGDTAQVGPQVARLLGIPQITYATEILGLTPSRITVKRRIDRGVETVETPVPALLTVDGSAAACRPRNARRLLTYKRYEPDTWSAADIDADVSRCGLSGSPTKVKAVENIVFSVKECKTLSASNADIEQLIVELISNHTIG